MPHIIIEYSDNLKQEIQSADIAAKAHEAAIGSGLFTPSAIKTRTYMAQDYLVGENGRNGSFVHIRLYILQGRTQEQKLTLSKTVFEALLPYLEKAEQFTVDIRELDKQVYQKKSS